jgi:hypothetical protein
MNGGMRNGYEISVGNSEEERSFGRPRSRWKIILEWMFEKMGGELWTGCICFRIGTSGKLL